MAAEAASTIAQLEAARQVVLSDAAHYSVVIPGVTPIIGQNALVDVRIWGASFIAESFASPILSQQQKETLGVQTLPLMHELLEAPGQNEAVVKSIIQAMASVYAPVFKNVVNNPQNPQTWGWVSAIKSNILKRFDSAPTGIRICCIKFVQRVIQVQTPGSPPDPRRPDQNEISSAIVPRDHPHIPPSRLEAEASGLLDRLLTVFYEDGSDALLIDATINGFAILARARPSLANKMVNAILNFNPFKQARAGMPLPDKIRAQSTERTATAFLNNYNRRNPNGPLAGRIAAQVQRLKQLRIETFDESRKRGPPLEPTDGLDQAKRIRLGAEVDNRPSFPPLPQGPVSVAQLFTLTQDQALKLFDVKPIPLDLVVKITLPVLQRIDHKQLDDAINAIRSRWLDLSRQQPPQPQPPAPVAHTAIAVAQPVVSQSKLDVDEDDYEPEFEPLESSEQIQNRIDGLPADDKPATDVVLGTFKLAQPPPLTMDEAGQLGKGAISRVFSMMNRLDEPSKTAKPGLNRLAGSGYDKDAWITVITRLATRATPPSSANPIDPSDKSAVLQSQRRGTSLGDGIRETLWRYIVEDFRHRIDIAIAWLNEEWYNDKISQKQSGSMNTASQSQDGEITQVLNYEKWVLKLLDAIIPYLDTNDKILIRFLGEIPEISQTVLERVKNMARDPDRVTLTVRAIYYLVMFKPPAKEAAIGAMVDLWNNYSDAKASVKPLLARVRPSAMGEQATNGVKKEEASSTPAPSMPEASVPSEATPKDAKSDSVTIAAAG